MLGYHTVTYRFYHVYGSDEHDKLGLGMWMLVDLYIIMHLVILF